MLSIGEFSHHIDHGAWIDINLYVKPIVTYVPMW